jgi:DNA-binding LacI/PurR family transcriptional regulator
MPIVLTQTKHYQTKVRLRKYLQELPAGSILPVVTELEELFSCSHGTMVYALKELAKEGLIVRPPRKQRYIVTQHTERGLPRIALVRPDFPSLGAEKLFRGIFERGRAQNWRMNLFCFRNVDELDFDYIAGNFDAMIILPASEDVPKNLIDRMLEMKKTIVLITEHVDNPWINNVVTNDEAVGRIAAREFHKRGYKRVLLIKDQPAESTMRLRIAGYRTEAAKLGIDCGDELFIDTELASFEELSLKLTTRFSEFLNSGIPFDAVFCLTIDAAIIVHKMLLASGRKIPQEVGLLAYCGENNIAEYFTPAITTLAIDLEVELDQIVSILENGLEGQTKPAGKFLIPVHLHERESLKK